MHGNDLFYQAFIYLAAAVVAVPLAKKLGLGSVLGYLIAGVVIGPYVIGLVGTEGQDVMHFAEFGVVMMLFLVGLELKPSLLWKLRVSILGLGGLQVFLTAGVIMAITMLVSSLQWQTALAIGLTLSMSSTAIVIQTLNEKGLMNTEGGQNAFSVLLFQDIAVIPMLAIFPLLAIKGASGSLHVESLLWIDQFPLYIKTGIIFSVVALIILGGRYLISPVFRLIAQTRLRELFTAAALLLIISIALLMNQVGLSPALGTFLAGVVLAQSEYRHELETDIEPFKGLLLGLFFIAVGASIDFKLIAENPALIALIVVGIVIVKFLILAFIGKIFGMKHDNNFLFTFSLAQGGEFAFVLFSFALQNGVMTSQIANPVIASVAITMALTPLLMIINEKFIQPRLGVKESEKRKNDDITELNTVIIAGFGRFGSTVGRFLQANGVSATYLDIDPNNVDLLRKVGLNVFYGDASRSDLLEAAGAGDATMLVVAVDDPEKALQIVQTARKNFPHLTILGRAQSWLASYEMADKGVDKIYSEYQESALRLGADVLSELGVRHHQAHRALKMFRKKNEKMIEELRDFRHERSDFILGTKQRIADMENLLQNELQRFGKDKDLGWDSTGMKSEFSQKKKNFDANGGGAL
jgi:monovalent cation:proton antiporter-2 (CPA2) family protein